MAVDDWIAAPAASKDWQAAPGAKTDDWQAAPGGPPAKPPPDMPTITVRATGDAAQPAKPMMTGAERFGTGLADPVVGSAQTLSHMMPRDWSRAVDDANNWLADRGVPLARIPAGGMDQVVREREADIAATTPPSAPRVETKLDDQGRASHVTVGKQVPVDMDRALGRMASPMTIAPALVPGGPLVRSTIGGALAAAEEPVSNDKPFWKEKGKQAAVGGAAGLATAVAGKTIANTVMPQFRPAAQRMLDNGVVLTPGQMAGGVFRRGEEAIKSLPILGTAIEHGERTTLDSFNRATANQALRSIGVTVPADASGHAIIEAGQQALSARYGALLGQLSFKADQQMASDLSGLMQLVQEMPKAQREQFTAVLNNRVMQRLQPTGTMNGDTMKQVESELSNFARQMRSSSDAAQRQLGHAIDEVNGMIRDTLRRQNPQFAGELDRLDQAYAMWTRVEGAAVRRAGNEGMFTPGDLLASIRTADKSVRKRVFARGDALLQDWAEDAGKVISNKLPDSGTASRLAWDALGVGAGVVNPYIPAGLAAGSLPYTRPGMAAGNAWATGLPGPRSAAANAVRAGAPFVSPMDAALAEYETGKLRRQ